MKYLKWGQTALRFVPKTKNAYGVLKRFLPKKKKKQKKNKKRIYLLKIYYTFGDNKTEQAARAYRERLLNDNMP